MRSHHIGIRAVMVGWLAASFIPYAAEAAGGEDVKSALTSIQGLYQELEYEQALQQITRARRYARTTEDKVVLFLYEGILLDELGRAQEAAMAFTAGLSLLPDATLPVRVSPKIGRHFESLRQEVVPEREPSVTRHESHVAEASPAPKQALPVRQEQKKSQALDVTASVPSTVSPGMQGSRVISPRVLLPAVAGGVLLAAGGVSWGVAKAEQSKLREVEPRFATLDDVRRSASRGRTYQTVGVGLLGAGLVGLGVATGLYVLQAPTAPVALDVGTDGTSAFVYGRWP